MVYSTRWFVLSLALCYFVLAFFSPYSNAITSLWEKRTNINAFRTFVLFSLVWFCLFPLPFGVWEGLRLVIVALPGLSFYLFFVRGVCFVINCSSLCLQLRRGWRSKWPLGRSSVSSSDRSSRCLMHSITLGTWMLLFGNFSYGYLLKQIADMYVCSQQDYDLWLFAKI